jgi:ADP-ribose pyrophosphatase
MGSEPQPWTLLASSMALDERWYKVRRDKVRLPDGVILDDYFVSVRPEVVVVFAVTADRQIPLVEQYKHGIGVVSLELPAGTFSGDGESACAAGERELAEEAGVHADSFQVVSEFYDDASKNSNRVHIVMALDATGGHSRRLDSVESSSGVFLRWSHLMDLRGLLDSGAIRAQSSVAAGYAGLSWLERNRPDLLH